MFNLKKLPFPLLWVFAATFTVASFYLRLRNPMFVDKVDVPVQGGYGIDLQAILEWTRAVFSSGASYFDQKFTPNVYPPIHVFLYAPFLFFSQKWAYLLFSFLSVTALALMLGFAVRINPRLDSEKDETKLLLVVGLIFALIAQSYPVLFCLERGNSDILNGMLCAGFLYFLIRNHKKSAIAILTLGAQIKVFPAFLAVFFVLKKDFKSLIIFVVLNTALMFIFGWRGVRFFLDNLAKIQATPYIWQGNHSIKSGVSVYFSDWPLYVPTILVGLFLMLFGFCVLLYIIRKNAESHFNRKFIALVGMSFMLMGLLPAHSHDYKLAMQVTPFVMLAVFESVSISLLGVAMSIFTALLFVQPHHVYPRTAILVAAFFGYFVIFFSRELKV